MHLAYYGLIKFHAQQSLSAQYLAEFHGNLFSFSIFKLKEDLLKDFHHFEDGVFVVEVLDDKQTILQENLHKNFILVEECHEFFVSFAAQHVKNQIHIFFILCFWLN